MRTHTHTHTRTRSCAPEWVLRQEGAQEGARLRRARQRLRLGNRVRLRKRALRDRVHRSRVHDLAHQGRVEWEIEQESP